MHNVIISSHYRTCVPARCPKLNRLSLTIIYLVSPISRFLVAAQEKLAKPFYMKERKSKLKMSDRSLSPLPSDFHGGVQTQRALIEVDMGFHECP